MWLNRTERFLPGALSSVVDDLAAGACSWGECGERFFLPPCLGDERGEEDFLSAAALLNLLMCMSGVGPVGDIAGGPGVSDVSLSSASALAGPVSSVVSSSLVGGSRKLSKLFLILLGETSTCFSVVLHVSLLQDGMSNCRGGLLLSLDGKSSHSNGDLGDAFPELMIGIGDPGCCIILLEEVVII